MSRKYFTGLDGLRGIAALAVVLYHTLPPSFQLLPRSYLAVDLFFALSGFVLFHIYMPDEARPIDRRTFLAQRLIRMYPLYALGTIGVFVLLLMGAMIGDGAHPAIGPMLASGLLNLFFLPVPPIDIFYGNSAFPFNFPAWSLFWELAVNVLFVMIARHLTASALKSLLVLGAALLAATALNHGSLDLGSTHASFWGGGSRVLYSFFIGGFVYRLWQTGRFNFTLPVPLAALMVTASFAPPAAGSMGALWDLMMALIGYPALLLGTANAAIGPRTARLCREMGLASFAIYALHAAVLAFIRMAAPHVTGQPIGDFPAVWAGPILGICVIVAVVADRWFDTPLRRWLSRRWQKPTHSAGMGHSRPTVTRPAAP